MESLKPKRILHFEGLYEELNATQSAEYLFSELISTRSRDFGWVIRPHIHTKLYQLFFVETGSLIFQGNLQEYSLAGPCLMLIPPTAIHGLRYQPEVKGRILTLSETIIEQIFKDSSLLLDFNNCQVISEFTEDISFEMIKTLLLKIDKELFDDLPEKRLMLQSFITELFILLKRIMHSDKITEGENVTIQHFKRFQQLIKTTENHPSISQFAEKLKISPVHLNRICQQVANKSALQLVQIHLIEESKKYLTYTSHSVSEIAYLLNFEYPNYFAKLFKVHTGLSPKEFRESLRKYQ